MSVLAFVCEQVTVTTHITSNIAMRVSTSSLFYFLTIAALLGSTALAKKPSRPPAAGRPSRPLPKKSSARAPPVSRRPQYDDEEEEDEEQLLDAGFDDDDEEYDEEPPSRPKRGPTRGKPSPAARPTARKQSPRNQGRPPYDDDVDDYEPRRRGPPPRGAARRGGPPPRNSRRGEMVPFTNQAGPSFTRGLAALRESLPDPSSLKEAASILFPRLVRLRRVFLRISTEILRVLRRPS